MASKVKVDTIEQQGSSGIVLSHDVKLASGTAIEINTSGWHKACAEQYPARQFLEMMNDAGIPLVISSDAHAPGDVGRDFERATCLALDTGFTHTARFEKRKRTLVALPSA